MLLQIDSGLKDELVLGDPNSPRYVLWGGRLRPVPAGIKHVAYDVHGLLARN
jgi:hypothetical protein